MYVVVYCSRERRELQNMTWEGYHFQKEHSFHSICFLKNAFEKPEDLIGIQTYDFGKSSKESRGRNWMGVTDLRHSLSRSRSLDSWS
jgi:hypothetical protein